MITGIDHIVIAVRSLERAIAAYRNLGFTVVVGGKHPYGSYNALIGFADGSYIELLGFYEDSPAHPWWTLLHERGGGLIDFCMATDDIRSDLAAFRSHGVDCGELTDGGRARPDGYQVRWINNKVGGAWQGLIPFIIEDLTPREERLPRETVHENSVSGIHTVSLATDDVARYAGAMSAVTGAAGQPCVDDKAGASGISLQVGGHQLEYLEPNLQNGALASHLAANRPAPYSVSFKTSGPSLRFDPSHTEGVRIALV